MGVAAVTAVVTSLAADDGVVTAAVNVAPNQSIAAAAAVAAVAAALNLALPVLPETCAAGLTCVRVLPHPPACQCVCKCV